MTGIGSSPGAGPVAHGEGMGRRWGLLPVNLGVAADAAHNACPLWV